MPLEKRAHSVGSRSRDLSTKPRVAFSKKSDISAEALRPQAPVNQPPEVDAEEPLKLPNLRSDLELHPVRLDSQGSPHWVVSDSIRSRYFKLGWLEYELLARWSLADADAVIESVNQETTLTANRADLERLIQFLVASELVVADSQTTVRGLYAKATKPKPALWRKGYRSTLFVKRKLVNPDRFLNSLLPLSRLVVNHPKSIFTLWGFAALCALMGVGAHSLEFTDTFVQYMNPTGYLYFGLALIFINILHEIGHGAIAKAFGCRVREMGVALIFLLPVAYCDTSDAWRLPSRQKRLAIAAAGIGIELLLAVCAALAWLVLPDGVGRTIAYFVAVTSLLSSVLINLNPCLKFDGYYLLSDWLGIDNLQQKSFETTKWRLKQWLLGVQEPAPHRVTQHQIKVLCRYALVTWVYRVFLYFAISLMVYQFWFKALGLVLMTCVFLNMLVKPVVVELWDYAKTIKSGRVRPVRVVCVTAALSLFVFTVVPIPRTVSMPAVVSAAQSVRTYSPEPARVTSIPVAIGSQVQAGDVLVRLENPQLSFEKAVLERELQDLQVRLQRKTGWSESSSHQAVSAEHLANKRAQLNSVIEQQNGLTLRAPFAGSVVSIPNWVQPGVWVAANTVLAEVVSTAPPAIRAYLPSHKVDELKGAAGHFETDQGKVLGDVHLQNVSETNIATLPDPLLSITHGGPIATQAGQGDNPVPLQGWHLATFKTDTEFNQTQAEIRGYLVAPTVASSLVSSAFQRIYGTIIRESGF